MVYFALQIRSEMFNCGTWEVTIKRSMLSVSQAREIFGKGVLSCFCPQCDAETIEAMRRHYEILTPFSEFVPADKVSLKPGDSVLVLDVPRLEWFIKGEQLGEELPTDMAFNEYAVLVV